MRDIVGNENGQIHNKGGISISHSGTPGSVLARMFIAKPNKGYSAAINFIDPDATASQKWRGNGLRLRNVNGVQVAPVVVARNTGAVTSNVGGRIVYTNPNGDVGIINFPQKTIASGATRIFELENLVSGLPASVTYGGIELEYDTPKGSVITSVQSVSQNGNHVFQVPMFDPLAMPTSAGGFPWKADGDFKTLVYIKNETESTKKYTAHLSFAGGKYSLGMKELKGGQTIAIDFRSLRDSQTLDETGSIIPLNVESGQIAWSAHGIETKTMSARSEQISVANGLASTYSCANHCPNVVDDVWIEPNAFDMSVGDTVPLVGMQTELNNYGQEFGPYVSSTVTWESYDTGVASAGFGGLEALNVGSTILQANFERTIWIDWNGTYCEAFPSNLQHQAPVEVAPMVQVTEVGFTGDHKISVWPSGTMIDPSDNAPTWKKTGDPMAPVAYTKGANISMFAKLSVNQTMPNTNAKIRVKRGSTVIASKDIVIGGTGATITGISATTSLENSVKTSALTFIWEISYNGGSSWLPVGSSGPHTIYWTYSTPLAPPFMNDDQVTDPLVYDLALQKATTYANGSTNLDAAINAINVGLDTEVYYQPNTSIGSQHPLDAYAFVSPEGCQCSDLANLLRGLLRSIGIDGTTTLIWAGPDANTLRRYTVGSTGNTNPSFRINRSAHDAAVQNPHFKFHAVVSTNSRWYDPSYGTNYTSLSFTETENNSMPQQTSSTFWSSQPLSTFTCPH